MRVFDNMRTVVREENLYGDALASTKNIPPSPKIVQVCLSVFIASRLRETEIKNCTGNSASMFYSITAVKLLLLNVLVDNAKPLKTIWIHLKLNVFNNHCVETQLPKLTSTSL